jgi:polyisoprenoid-binding protein YceI
MSRLMLSATLGLVLGLAATAAAPVLAQAPAPPTPPMVTKDPMTVPAGNYKLDKTHQSVVARIGHGGGFSYSTVRFGATEGLLTWDPAHIENSKISVTVDMKANYAPIVYNVPPDAPNLLNVAAFPTSTFVSTGVRRTGPTTGQIMGNLTLMGKTAPAVIDATLVGAGKNGRGVPVIGFTGTMKIKRSDFGFTALAGAISNDIDLTIDGEFGPA